MKKPFVRSPLEAQPLHVKQQLAAWLTTGGPHGQGITYREARAKLFAEHGVSASLNALNRFFQRHTRVAPALRSTFTIPFGTVAVTPTESADGKTITLTFVITLKPLQP